jgi:hypothetical protein
VSAPKHRWTFDRKTTHHHLTGERDMAPKRILLLTNSDLGQASCFLAVLYTLLCRSNDDVEIHIGSFPKLEAQVAKYVARASQDTKNASIPSRVKFHKITGESHLEHALRPSGIAKDIVNLRPGLMNTSRFLLQIPNLHMPWTPEEYGDIYLQTKHIFDAVKPDLTAIDPVFSAGLTLLWSRQGARWTVLSPNTFNEFVQPLQPRGALFWKYPMYAPVFY